MEELFTTELTEAGGTAAYRVVFDADQYRFIPEDGSGSGFAFVREHDEWHAVAPVPDAVAQQALDALDRYLLQQH